MEETTLKKRELQKAAKELNKVLQPEPEIDIYQNVPEILEGIKEVCRDCLAPGDDFTWETLKALELLNIEIPERPEEPDTTIYDAAEVILDFMPQLLERIKGIEELLFDIANPELAFKVGIGYPEAAEEEEEEEDFVSKANSLISNSDDDDEAESEHRALIRPKPDPERPNRRQRRRRAAENKPHNQEEE